MKRYGKPLAVGAALVGALLLTITRSGPESGHGANAQTARGAGPQRAAKHYDLSALRAFRVILGRVTDSYVDPRRIKPRQMLLGALHGVEKSVAEVLVDESADGKKVVVRVEDVERSFDLEGLDSPWALNSVVKRVLRFIQPHLHSNTKIRDVEYAAINGMLSTLDPHSILLRPELYNEMKLSTRGHFGGLGIVISMINSVLTVINPIKGTPAYGAGIKACDQILKIGEESTVNMTLSQAVKRLRGAPGSKVVITIKRAAWSKPVRKTLARAVIKVHSVKSRLLAKHIGYIKLSSFQGNSLDDIKEHLSKLKSKGMKGLILDMRGNPGGLLDQAIKISDLFIEAGTLLTTVSHAGKRREEKRAHRGGTEERYPIAALVNSGSASASEIVSGALKNLDRGVIIGSRTFGKGTVQVLYDNEDGSALKLTIAQYLTPGDISIQTVGITPDVLTDPVVVRREYIRLREHGHAPSEKDLRKHLTHHNARANDKPLRSVRYLAKRTESKKKKKPKTENLCLYPDRQCKPTNDEKFVLDFQIRLARDFLAQAKGWRRSQLLAASGSFFQRIEEEQDRHITGALRKLNIDWARASQPVGKGEPKLAVTVTTDPPGSSLRACRAMKVKVKVKNVGETPAYRLRAVTKSSQRLFSKRELVFGRLNPGQSRSWELPIKVRDVPDRIDELRIDFHDQAKTAYAPYISRLTMKGAPRPVFAYGYQLVDDVKGNLDGKVQRGEQLRLFVRVKNTGKGPAFRAVTRLKNLSGVGVFVRKGRFVLGRLEPGQVKTIAFILDVQQAYRADDFKVELTVLDDGLREYVTEKLSFPVADSIDAPIPAKGFVKAKTSIPFRAWGDAKAPVIGWAPRHSSFQVLGRTKSGWYRVLASPHQPAFLATSDVQVASGVSGRFAARWQVTPPRISLKMPALVTSDQKVRLQGSATDETKISDVFIFVRNPDAKIEGQKVFYRSNRNSKTPKRLDFSVDVPLWAGTNYVTVFARESNDTQVQEMVVIHRKTTKQVAKKASGKPKTRFQH
ncbi:MAG: PDZ domain-containing protein [Deltaproteobacteria bacterium]|nr:PDZ domain-containing protein [Deltaproteobacteria bacterium]